MKKFIISIVSLGCFLVTASAYSQMGMMGERGMMRGGGMMDTSRIRHQFVMRNGVDPAYVSKSNPLKPTDANLTSGKGLFKNYCAACHGLSGRGDGEAGKSLNPPPSNIAASSKMRMATDGYLFWTIAEGGVPLGTAMPPFKNSLKEDQIWKIILYLREL